MIRLVLMLVLAAFAFPVFSQTPKDCFTRNEIRQMHSVNDQQYELNDVLGVLGVSVKTLSYSYVHTGLQVGIQVATGHFFVLAVFPRSSAKEAGVTIDERIVAVNGSSLPENLDTQGEEAELLLHKIQVEKNTLTLRRGNDTPREVTLEPRTMTMNFEEQCLILRKK